MMARLGNVLYWAGCVFAGAHCCFFGALMAQHETQHAWSALVSFAVMAGIIWVLGRACRYVLAGR